MIEEEIFHQALALSRTEERTAYLEQACAGNPALRASVEALLRANAGAGGFMDQPAPALVATLAESVREGPGTVIGPYKLLEQIGEGGFGVVFMAEQTHPVRRKVALKVIKPGMDTRQVIARFDAERQALAMMEHAHIAKVFDGGTTDATAGSVGRPYFVMELVRGLSMTEYCDQHSLPIRERLELFVDVCQAVQHAHQKGIIHRDIKPSNVLVTLHDGKPVVKVIDFGVAKAMGQQLTDKTLFTNIAQMVGTPLYMSPEQAEMSGLDVDTRSDIYSLGVLLYELLTGTTPFDKDRLRPAGFDEIRRIIREEEPPKPSNRMSTLDQAASTASEKRQSDPRKLSRLFRGELDWIVMKALEKDRNRRYETASALAADVRRYLSNQPVEACPPSVGYRLRKFVRRHKGPVLAASVIAVLVTAGIAGTTTGLVWALAAERETGNALNQVTAEQEKTQAALSAETAAKGQTREALDALTDDVVETIFAKQPELTEGESAFLRKVLGFYEAFTKQSGETAEARFLRAKGYFKVAHLRALLGEQVQAVEGYRQAVTLLEQLADESPEVSEYREKLARTHNNLGILLAELNNDTDAEKSFRQAVALWEKLPEGRQQRRALAASHNDLATLQRRQKNYADADQAYHRALHVAEKEGGEAGADPPDRQQLARIRANLAGLLREQQEYEKAEELYRQALDVQEKILAKFPAVPKVRRELADAYHGLAITLAEMHRETDAETAFNKSLDLRRKLRDDFPNVAQYRRELGNTCNDLSNLLVRQKKYADAEKPCRDALELREKLTAKAGAGPRDRQDLARSYDALAKVLRATSRPEDMEKAEDAARAVWEQLAADFPKVAEYHNELAGTLGKLAGLRFQRGDFSGAAALLEQARPHHQAALKAERENPKYRQYYHNTLLTLVGCYGSLADHAKVALTADELARLGYEPANDAFVAASIMCRCVKLADKDAQLDENKRRELAQVYANRALALLRQAVESGFTDAAKMRQDPSLEPVRTREEFRKLLAELEGKSEG
jgi:serine/threonine protein kinase/tetratricopeptide (TPR) repeat protein